MDTGRGRRGRRGPGVHRRRAAAASVAAIVTATLTGCSGIVLDACPAIGYLYSGPAVVEFSPPPPPGSTTAACFGDECTPAPFEPVGDVWQVPQQAPYLGAGTFGDGSETTLRIVVVAPDPAGAEQRTLVDDAFEIPVSVERTGIFGQCTGPFSFEPVEVVLD
ncbi:hypothetical protein [Agromyces neolithicus]